MSLEAIKKALEGVTPDRLRYEADAMYAAVQGEEYGDTFHAFNWADKPHRVLYDAINLIRDSASEIDRLQRENAELRNLADRFKLEAQGHAMEAKTANSTIYEIYQIVTGAKGEPGNWRGAEPVRKYVSQLMIDASNHAADAETVRREREVERRRAEAAEAEVERLQTELALSKPLYSRRQIEARVKLLEAALKPFADLAPSYDPPEDDDDHKCWHAESTPTLGDLRRASNALASTGGEHHADK